MWTVANCKQRSCRGCFPAASQRVSLCYPKGLCGLSLVPQWLRLCAPNAGGPALISDQGARSHMLQRRVRMPQLERKRARERRRKKGRKGGRKKAKILHAATKKIPHAATGARHSQINLWIKKTEGSWDWSYESFWFFQEKLETKPLISARFPH